VTDFEKALLKLKAFKELAGWGTTTINKKGEEEFTKNTFEQRKDLADSLYNWLIEDVRVDHKEDTALPAQSLPARTEDEDAGGI
jgi:hypothetical protein